MQQAMFVIFFFLLVFILLSGLFTHVESMPAWAQRLAAFSPLKYFVQALRGVYLKGSTLRDLLPQLGAICAFAVVLNGWAVMSYKKRG
jgi:ABC-2 type transport system permease protein